MDVPELSNEEVAKLKNMIGQEAELAIYQSLDEMCGKIFACADDETIMAIISDHGARPNTRRKGTSRTL